MNYVDVKNDLKKLADPVRAKNSAWFFKTGKGEYGEGDVFIGLTMPQIRSVIKKYTDLSLADVQQLLNSEIHEFRMAGALILVKKYELIPDLGYPKSGMSKKRIFDFYLKNTARINNWDLVDLSAPRIVGKYLLKQSRLKSANPRLKPGRKLEILYKLARSKNLWEKRIAVLSNFPFIDASQFADALKIAKILLNDQHDLIHKAVGWMLREIGKRDEKVIKKFLDQHVSKMPRTMLRYAIEKLSEKERKEYLEK